jgi:hypothetical protein
VAGSLAAPGDSLPGSLTRVTRVVRAGVRTGRRPARGSLRFEGIAATAITAGRVATVGEVWLERGREVHGLARGVR